MQPTDTPVPGTKWDSLSGSLQNNARTDTKCFPIKVQHSNYLGKLASFSRNLSTEAPTPRNRSKPVKKARSQKKEQLIRAKQNEPHKSSPLRKVLNISETNERSYSREAYICTICSRTYNYSKALQNHMHAKHNVAPTFKPATNKNLEGPKTKNQVKIAAQDVTSSMNSQNDYNYNIGAPDFNYNSLLNMNMTENENFANKNPSSLNSGAIPQIGNQTESTDVQLSEWFPNVTDNYLDIDWRLPTDFLPAPSFSDVQINKNNLNNQLLREMVDIFDFSEFDQVPGSTCDINSNKFQEATNETPRRIYSDNQYRKMPNVSPDASATDDNQNTPKYISEADLNDFFASPENDLKRKNYVIESPHISLNSPGQENVEKINSINVKNTKVETKNNHMQSFSVMEGYSSSAPFTPNSHVETDSESDDSYHFENDKNTSYLSAMVSSPQSNVAYELEQIDEFNDIPRAEVDDLFQESIEATPAGEQIAYLRPNEALIDWVSTPQNAFSWGQIGKLKSQIAKIVQLLIQQYAIITFVYGKAHPDSAWYRNLLVKHQFNLFQMTYFESKDKLSGSSGCFSVYNNTLIDYIPNILSFDFALSPDLNEVNCFRNSYLNYLNIDKGKAPKVPLELDTEIIKCLSSCDGHYDVTLIPEIICNLSQ